VHTTRISNSLHHVRSKIGKLNNLKVIGSKKTEESTPDTQVQLRLTTIQGDNWETSLVIQNALFLNINTYYRYNLRDTDFV